MGELWEVRKGKTMDYDSSRYNSKTWHDNMYRYYNISKYNNSMVRSNRGQRERGGTGGRVLSNG